VPVLLLGVCASVVLDVPVLPVWLPVLLLLVLGVCAGLLVSVVDEFEVEPEGDCELVELVDPVDPAVAPVCD